MNQADTLKTLENLAEISRDGEKGFLAAADGVTDPQIKSICREAAARCAVGARELEQEIEKLGGQATGAGSISGTAHRAWTDIKAMLTGRDDKAILAECERGEDVAKAEYERALQRDLPPDIEAMVQRQYAGVRQNHDLIKNLRDSAV